MPDEIPRSAGTPDAMDINHYAVMADQGVVLVAILNFGATAAISVVVASDTWLAGVDTAYRAASLAPGILATLLAACLGPRIWRRIVVDGHRFSAAKSALAGVLTVVVVHIVTIELFLAVGFGFLWWFEPDFPYFDEFPGLVVMAPLSSFWVIGRLTLPVGTAIAVGVALYCQNRVSSRLR